MLSRNAANIFNYKVGMAIHLFSVSTLIYRVENQTDVERCQISINIFCGWPHHKKLRFVFLLIVCLLLCDRCFPTGSDRSSSSFVNLTIRFSAILYLVFCGGFFDPDIRSIIQGLLLNNINLLVSLLHETIYDMVVLMNQDRKNIHYFVRQWSVVQEIGLLAA